MNAHSRVTRTRAATNDNHRFNNPSTADTHARTPTRNGAAAARGWGCHATAAAATGARARPSSRPHRRGSSPPGAVCAVPRAGASPRTGEDRATEPHSRVRRLQAAGVQAES